MHSAPPIIIWLRRDLRCVDHPAFLEAMDLGAPVIPLFIWSKDSESDSSLGSASKWWLHQSLHKMELLLKKMGSRLIIRVGNPLTVIKEIANETHAKAVFWSRCYEPSSQELEKVLIKELEKAHLNVKTFNSHLLFEPGELNSKDKKPFHQFAPFWHLIEKKIPLLPITEPLSLSKVSTHLHSEPLDSLQLEQVAHWTSGIKSSWQPGEESALKRLHYFIEHHLANYAKDRDRPDLDITSHLSPHLHFGEVSCRLIWHEVKQWMEGQENPKTIESADAFLRQLAWREFSYHTLFHFPKSANEPLNPKAHLLPWKDNQDNYDLWKSGKTGYPIVDAGMRQLWITGWIPNRIRMIVASFLVKDLLIPWQKGAKWFKETLVDADLANNTMGWQWVSGCGIDSAPYFHIFNPVLQGEKFDPSGDYIRRWVPEISKLNNHFIHKPWLASELDLNMADITLGKEYPSPIVNHEKARKHILQAHK